MAKRVTIFFDWQNVYMRARDAFGDSRHDPAQKGQVSPVDLAQLLTEREAERRPGETLELAEVRIYRGRPVAAEDQRGYNAFQRQTAIWAQNSKVVPRYRDLRYPIDWGESSCVERPREKGVDVALAVDLVVLAKAQDFDIAVVMSADYDLVPALDHVVHEWQRDNHLPEVSVAAWSSDIEDRPLRLRLQQRPLWCNWLTREDYWGVEDVRDYSVQAAPRPNRAVPGSWLK